MFHDYYVELVHASFQVTYKGVKWGLVKEERKDYEILFSTM